MLLRRALSFVPATLVAATVPCRAQPPDAGSPLDLEWTAPEGCPNEADVRARIARLARSTSEGGRRLRATARVDSTPEGAFRVALETFTAEARDTRELVGASCEAVADSVAVVLALRLGASSDEPPPAAPPPPLPKPEQVPPPGAPRAPPTHSRLSLGVALTGDSSVLPGATLGGTVQAALRSGNTMIALTGTYWIPRDVALSAERDAAFRWASGAVQGCQELARLGGSGHLGPCLAIEAGAMSAESFGVRIPGQTTEPWLAARAGARLSLDVTRALTLAFGLEAAVPFRRPEFVVEGVGTVHRPAPLSARAAASAEWWF